jgi:hypothetical protein
MAWMTVVFEAGMNWHWLFEILESDNGFPLKFPHGAFKGIENSSSV